MRAINRLLLASLLVVAPAGVFAADDASAEPDVTIRQDGDKTIQEYRVNGFLYAIKVTPRAASPISWSAQTATATSSGRTTRTC